MDLFLFMFTQFILYYQKNKVRILFLTFDNFTDSLVLHSINHLVQYFKNNILTEKMIFNLSAHLIVFENIKQYF
ncbi:Uncharacterised protein [Streptococcus pneumoniae]|nr:Uncharacterised protein [Streptococcus pneumoniae]